VELPKLPTVRAWKEPLDDLLPVLLERVNPLHLSNEKPGEGRMSRERERLARHVLHLVSV